MEHTSKFIGHCNDFIDNLIPLMKSQEHEKKLVIPIVFFSINVSNELVKNVLDEMRNISIQDDRKKWMKIGQYLEEINEKHKSALESLDLTSSICLDAYEHFKIRFGQVEEFFKKESKNLTLENEIINQLPNVDISTQREQIRLMHELGIIEFLREKYGNTLKTSNNEVAGVIAKILKLKQTSIQPTLNALISNNPNDKNYPKITNKIKSIMDYLNSNEQF